jgi:hypothetical protein
MADQRSKEEREKQVAWTRMQTATDLIAILVRNTEGHLIAGPAAQELWRRASHYDAVDAMLITAQEASINDGKPYATEAPNTVIIPAATGWFAAVADTGEVKKLDKEPVIAWSIEWDSEKEVHKVWPITFNQCRNDGFGMSPGYVLCDPHGNFASTYYDDQPKTMTSEAEAIKHSLDEIAMDEKGVVRVDGSGKIIGPLPKTT